MKGQIKTGTFTGTGAALAVSLGFVPDFIMLANKTDGNLVAIWTSDMAAGTGIDILVTTGTGSNVANGITPYPGTEADAGPGFTAGTDYSLAAKQYVYVAVANQ